MLSKLSLKNLRRSWKNYAIYFLTLVLGTAIFYVFNSLEAQTIMLNVSARQHELIGMMNAVMNVLSVGIAVILGFLILYASRFLMKRRKAEFGIYMTLGMGKGQIARILLFETLIIGLVSLAVGLGLGIIASQAMSVLVANMFEINMTRFHFVFSLDALLITLAMFGAIYLVITLFSTIMVGRTRLINLIRARATNEKVKLRNPILCTILFIAATTLLTLAYRGVTVDFNQLTDQRLVIFICFGIAGTFLLFWSLSGLLLRLARAVKNFYYRGLNHFVLRELDSRINTAVISMSIISLLLFATIGVFSSAISIRDSINDNLKKYASADFQFHQHMPRAVSLADDNGNIITVTDPDEILAITGQSTLTIEPAVRELDVDLEQVFRDYAAARSYYLTDITFEDTIGIESLLAAGGDTYYNRRLVEEHAVRVSEYNRLADLYGNPRVELSADEYAMVANYEATVAVRNHALARGGSIIEINDRTLRPAYHHTIDGFIYISDSASNHGILVVPDDLDLSGYAVEGVLSGDYYTTDLDAIAVLDSELSDLIGASPTNYYRLNSTSRQEIYDNNIGLSTMATFIGLYLGSVFLITSAALLGLKEVSESSDNQEKYAVLSRLGAARPSLSRALFAQQIIFFGLPLLVACIHSIFGIEFANKVLVGFAGKHLLGPIIATALFILGIYGGYFLLTYLMSRRIVLERDR